MADRVTLRRFLRDLTPLPILQYYRKVRYTLRMRGGTGDYDSEMNVIRFLVRPGDTVADVGASLGWYTRFLSDLVGHQGKVFSFEPMIREFEILDYVRRSLRLTNVQAINAAVSDQDKFVEMTVPDDDTGDPNLYLARVNERSGVSLAQVVTVPARSLDSIVGETGKPFQFIKCDVEGHEWSVLMGASKLLAESRPALMVEIWGNLDDQAEAGFRTARHLLGFGYRDYIFDGTTLTARTLNRKSENGNYFFLTPEHICQIGSGIMVVTEASK